MIGQRAPEAVVTRNAVDAAKRRTAELAAAFEFLTTGASEGPSPDGEPWNRDYDPFPVFEALPDDLRMYDGTGVGALYGLAPEVKTEHDCWYGGFSFVARSLVADLAGWNVRRRRA